VAWFWLVHQALEVQAVAAALRYARNLASGDGLL